jgi:hypothetical protein
MDQKMSLKQTGTFLFFFFSFHSSFGREKPAHCFHAQQPATPSTNAQRYRSLDVIHCRDCPFATTSDNTVRQVSRLFEKAPQTDASETKVVQPYWAARLGVLNSIRTTTLKLVDTHLRPSFGSRKPDLVAYSKGQAKSVPYIAVVGELKARRAKGNKEFDADEKGQLESYLEELAISYQPWRKAIYGFLSDGALIQFFQLSLGDVRHKFYEWPILKLKADGAEWLARMLGDPASASTACQDISIKDKPVHVVDYLGRGGSAVVFAGQWRGKAFFIFIFFIISVAFLHPTT